MRFTEGGKSTQPKGSRGDRCTRLSRTAGTVAQSGSLAHGGRSRGSMVTMTSGAQASTCSRETLARPPRSPPATLRAPRNSMVSTLIEPAGRSRGRAAPRA